MPPPPRARRPPPPSAPRAPHETVYGRHAVLALARARPGDLLRVYLTVGARDELEDLLIEAAGSDVPLALLDDRKLQSVAESVHHEGVCAFARARFLWSPDDLATQLAARGAAMALALDGVSNPHNLGAIVRSAAYFGADGLLLAGPPGASPLTPAAVRIAEGGAERVPLARGASLPDALRTLRARGVTVLGTDAQAGRPALGYPYKLPCVLVLGSEREGLAPEVRALCHDAVAIPGANNLDSLNVSVAAGILLAELARVRGLARATGGRRG